MTDSLYESGSFLLPSQLKQEMASRLKEKTKIRGLELELKGEALQDAKEFGEKLLALRKRGAKISHEVSLKLEFPQTLSRETLLAFVESLPKPVNGSLKIRVQLNDAEQTPAEAKF